MYHECDAVIDYLYDAVELIRRQMTRRSIIVSAITFHALYHILHIHKPIFNTKKMSSNTKHLVCQLSVHDFGFP